jgi:murein DD-endopeptidase MepM/ murein hydrolase activator NlpD
MAKKSSDDFNIDGLQKQLRTVTSSDIPKFIEGMKKAGKAVAEAAGNRIGAKFGFGPGASGGVGGGGGTDMGMGGPSTMNSALSKPGVALTDFTNFATNMAGGMSKMMAPVQPTLQRAATYYNASITMGQNRLSVQQATFGRLQNMGAITSAGSDAAVANILGSSGMSLNRDVYGQTVQSIGNAAKYLNMDNATAARAVSGMTGGQGASNMLRGFGIYTSDLKTGKEKTQGQIFEELANRLTAGRPGANVEETMDSIRRGNLGATIETSGLSEEQQTMFKQYMIDRAGKQMSGDNMSSAWDMGKSGMGDPEKANPLTGMMQIETSSTKAMAAGENNYIEGINGAAQALGVLNDASAALSASFAGIANAFGKVLQSNNVVQGMTDMTTASLDLTSSGLKAILSTTLFGSNPQMAAAGAIATATGAGGLVTTGVMASMGGAAPNPQGEPKGGPDSSTSTMTTATQGISNVLSTASSTVISEGGKLGAVLDKETVYSKFDSIVHGKLHKGIDYSGTLGTPIYAAFDGFVLEARDGFEASTTNSKTGKVTYTGGNSTYGNYVRLEHKKKDGGVWYTTYAHMKKGSVAVKEKQQVKKGDKLGEMGRTGKADGVHLHYEVAENDPNNKVDPKKAQEFIGNTQTANLDVNAMSQASSAANAMIGLASGNMETMKTALATLASSFGLGNINFSKATAAPGGSSGGTSSSGASGSVTAGGSPINTTINVNIPSASPEEAKKFADMVAEYHENALLSSNMGSF